MVPWIAAGIPKEQFRSVLGGPKKGLKIPRSGKPSG